MKHSLAEIQSTVQKSIAQNTSDALALLRQPSRSRATAAFNVYQDAYFLRLKGFLAIDYPMLKTYLGDDRFHELACRYVDANPSHTSNARWYSDHMPLFLQSNRELENNPECIELANLEHALTQAFDAIDLSLMTMADLAAIDPEKAGDLRMQLHPAATILSFRQNTIGIWSALKAGNEPPRPFKYDQWQKVLVFRLDDASRFRLLGEEEAMALSCVKDSMSFAALCEMMAFQRDDGDVPQRAAMFLRTWIESQLLLADTEDGTAK